MITSELFSVLVFWFYTVGVNVCPADTRNKRISESWKPMQTIARILTGRPIFLSCDNDKIQPYETIQEDIKVIKPSHPENYPYQPFEFENILNSNGKGKSGNSSNTSTIGVSTPDIRITKNWLKNIRRALVRLLRNYGGNNKNNIDF